MPRTKSGETEHKLFYSIGEVAEICGVRPHVLRYWERKYREISPKKSAGGKRLYQPKDLLQLQTLKRQLREGKSGLGQSGAKLGQSTADDGAIAGDFGELEHLRRILRQAREELQKIKITLLEE